MSFVILLQAQNMKEQSFPNSGCISTDFRVTTPTSSGPFTWRSYWAGKSCGQLKTCQSNTSVILKAIGGDALGTADKYEAAEHLEAGYSHLTRFLQPRASQRLRRRRPALPTSCSDQGIPRTPFSIRLPDAARTFFWTKTPSNQIAVSFQQHNLCKDQRPAS